MEKLAEWIERNYVKAAVIAVGLLALLVGCLILNAARAADMSVSWTYPTTNTDGTAIPATGAGSISGFVLEWGTCSGTAFGSKLGGAAPAAPATSYTITGLAPGTYCVRLAAVNTYAIVSAFSSVATKTIAAPTPNPPVLTIATIAYELREYSGGTLRFVQVGTVPKGAQCADKLAGNYYAFAGATITKPTTGGIVAAKCG